MEEDTGVELSVTRLRRRLSDDVKSPAPSTPTKKRGGRLSMKPQLDLIDEDVPISSLKQTIKKSAAKGLTELMNSRDSAKTYDSPRAIRAARRHSLSDSVNESNVSITPTRQTRRTRKNSTASLEYQAEYTNRFTIDPSVVEESEHFSQKSSNNFKSTDIIQTDTYINRKSPSLVKGDPENFHLDDGDCSDCYLCHKYKAKTDKSSPKPEKSSDTTIKEIEIIVNIPTYIGSSKKLSIIDDSSNISSNQNQYITKSDKLHNSPESNKENIFEYCHHSISNELKEAPVGDIELTIDKEDSEGSLEYAGNVKLIEMTSVDKIQSTIIHNYSDSENAMIENADKHSDNEDQCVPVLDHQEISANQQEQDIDECDKENPENKSLNDTKHKRESTSSACISFVKTSNNDSCEPMDIDESLPINVSIAENNLENSLKNTSITVQLKPKLSISQINESIISNKTNIELQPTIQHLDNSENEMLYGFQEESGEANETSYGNIIGTRLVIQDFEKTGNKVENTLILSGTKDDVSCIDNNLTMSPKVYKAEVISNSVNVPEATKENEDSKKNITLKELSGTPLKQKCVEKLETQTSTPVINTNDESNKMTISLPKNTSKAKKSSKTSNVSKNLRQINSDTEDELESESSDNLMMIDDQAQEASDNYESGDSRDEEEKQYEKENEIPENGTTLTSEEDFSDDTDYEKDSFVITSDEEYNELLSGTGDDLSMSEDELTMSAKSKKKFNERKRKQQKEASREMFESRHKLNVSVETSNTSKVKNYNRRRLDSSTSESVCEDDEFVEKEIANVCEQNMMGKNDVSIGVKQDVMTLQKDPNISATNFIVKAKVELDKNVSAIDKNELVEPLQTTVANGEDASSSEIEEITRNNDSKIEDLNNARDNKTRLFDISLNLNKKSKEKKKESIIDQLNLTETKHRKKNKSIPKDVVNGKKLILSKDLIINKEINFDKENSCDSIDIHSLFCENNDVTEDNEEIATENGLDNACEVVQNISVGSAKKHRKGTKSELSLTIDTETYNDKDSEDTSNISVGSSKKQKKKTKSQSSIDDSTAQDLELAVKETTNSSVGTSKKRRKKDRNSESLTVDTTTVYEDAADNDTRNSSLNNSMKLKKKKLSMDNNESQDYKGVDIVTEVVCDTSTDNSRKHKKKHSKLASESQQDSEDTSNVSVGSSKKQKKKTKSQSSIDDSTAQDLELAVEETTNSSVGTSKKRRKKDRNSESLTVDTTTVYEDAADNDTRNNSLNNSKKLKKKAKLSTDDNESQDYKGVDIVTEVACDTSADNSKKRKRKRSKLASSDTEIQQEPQELIEETEVTHDLALGKSKKHKKKAKSESTVEPSMSHVAEPLELIEEREVTHDLALALGKSKKHKKKAKSASTVEPATSHVTEPLELIEETEVTHDLALGKSKKHKKKAKSESTVEPATSHVADEINNQFVDEEHTTDKKSKNKKRNTINYDDARADSEPEPSVKRNKKRKQREDDDVGGKKPKVPKADSDTVFPQLSASVLDQLEDRTTETYSKRSVAIATTEFKVKKSKKNNKPSNYLEQSIYLNLTPVKKHKSRLNKPKVLPFLPTASTSGSGSTSNIRLDVLPQNIQFVAQSSDIVNFKNEYLNNKRIKKFGTYDTLKKIRNFKLSKF